MSKKLSITDVNKLSNEQFETIFGNVIELCPDGAVQVKNKRPFSNVSDLCDAFQTYLEEINVEDKLVVLKLHPDLAGKMAARGELTRESTAEQQAAGLQDLTTQQKSIMDESNQRYKEKFGFPFIICAKENKVVSIINGLQQRYHNSYEQEVNTGINEVKKICRLRILDIVAN
ncbi:2-oxo-4-hydroxy-4-carboxy-5-ureidoimidazoline decarboxylase-like [Anticarsia gemmatalis]|uniref:2-oxo-4-hydroxy-4-carboxy-5-ureidoimidazoline decarboxylase-like n=1 Tax=Anticarsia gemmatalis TaxID=129554 RepID=UPI003F7776B3